MARKKKEAKAAVHDCPRCGRKAWKPDLVQKTGKSPGVVFRYRRYRHPTRYGRSEVHYVRVDGGEAS
jgi:hypothetical protein